MGIGDLSMRHLSAVESLVSDWHGQKAIQISGATVVEPVDDFESAEGRSCPRGLLRCDRLSPWKPPRSAVM
jgi:hypothetical protein